MAEEQNRTLQDKFMLRLPGGMRERIKAAADSNNRSMNSEIVATLEDTYGRPQPVLPLDQQERLFSGESPLLVWREFRELSQWTLSLSSGVDETLIDEIEAGKPYQSLQVVIKLADALDVAIDDLI